MSDNCRGDPPRFAGSPAPHVTRGEPEIPETNSVVAGNVGVNMNPTLVSAQGAALRPPARLLLKPVDEWPAPERVSGGCRARRPQAGGLRRAAAARPVGRSVWIVPAREPVGEKVLYGALAAAAIWAVAYGLLSVIERAENWAAFNAWVGRILGA